MKKITLLSDNHDFIIKFIHHIKNDRQIFVSSIFLPDDNDSLSSDYSKIKTIKNSDLEILNAELSYLKRPDRIEKIALNKLELKEILPTDIWNLKDLVEATKSINARVPK